MRTGSLRALVSGLSRRSAAATAHQPAGEFLPHTVVHPDRMPTFEDLSEDYPDDEVPPLDRAACDESRLTWDQLHWRRHGYLILPRFMPDDLIDAYLKLRDDTGIGLGGFENTVWDGTAEEIKNLGCHPPLAQKIEEICGEPLALNFTLTQFTSTERKWHQDDYLGSEKVYGRYCAVWIALGDIHPDSGPFEFIPGSHRWACMRGRLIREHLEPAVRHWQGLPGEGGHWAQMAEAFTTPAYEDKIERENGALHAFHARRGDVLIWHGKLVHRGAIARIRGMRRPALICHYYPTDLDPHRIPLLTRHRDGGLYWRAKEF